MKLSTLKALVLVVTPWGLTVTQVSAQPEYPPQTGQQRYQALYGVNTSTMALSSPQSVQAIKELHHINMMEIQMGQLAQKNALSPSVRSFADRLVAQHRDMDIRTQDAARQLNVELPEALGTMDKKEHATMDKLDALTGSKFDIAFAKEMVKGHEKAIRNFEAGQNALVNPAADLINQALPVMKEHLRVARELATNLHNTRNPS